MDFNIIPELQQYLESNEKLIWSGQPKKGIVFRTSDIFLIPFSILWCGFAIFWFTAALVSGASILFAMFGVPFVCVGLFFVFGRFIFDAKNRENTFYGLTDNRIIIRSGVFKKTIKSINLKTLSEIEYEERSDGSGTINFGPVNPFFMRSNNLNWFSGSRPNTSLELIQDVRKVYNKIREIQQSR
jgi:hypothetical protein